MPKTAELFVPVITPFLPDLSVDTARLVDHAQWLMANGADGLAPFGTTSEANSLIQAERMTALEALVAAGISPDRLIPGTGACAIGDAVTLGKHAVDLGCRGVLALPPFYYKNVPEDGIFDAYARMIEGIDDPRLRVYLYHIPQTSGVAITLSLIDRLIAAFGNVIAGLKDSSGNWDNTRAVIETFPTLAVYSASESRIPDNVAAGGAGCISASLNVNTRGIRALVSALGTAEEAAAHAQVSQVRQLFESVPLVPAIKEGVALLREDPAFATIRPPYTRLDAPARAVVAEAVALSCNAVRG